ncbi:hypothetical protein ACVP6W_002221 [Vibrio cholerae]|uniref:hypothetical protein n=1 Tax=Vibrio cholerae TaxID=666 RepID=UPI000E6898F2|nr:hypothetical protein [Vibrio cholerae]EGQ8013366.1 hypothetical protein [Vibrio cholerae]
MNLTSIMTRYRNDFSTTSLIILLDDNGDPVRKVDCPKDICDNKLLRAAFFEKLVITLGIQHYIFMMDSIAHFAIGKSQDCLFGTYCSKADGSDRVNKSEIAMMDCSGNIIMLPDGVEGKGMMANFFEPTTYSTLLTSKKRKVDKLVRLKACH